MNEWIKRGLWGLVFVALVIFCTYSGFLPVLALTSIVSSICIYEYLKMLKLNSALNLLYAFLINFLILGLCDHIAQATFYENTRILPGTLIVLGLLFFVFSLIKNTTEFLTPLSKVFFANIYISLPFLLFLNLQPAGNNRSYDWRYPMLVFFLVWSSDTFAYIAGRLLGKKPLFEVLSPKKTVEGFAGGAILSCAVGILLAYLWSDVLTYTDGIILSILVSVFGTMGDLAESALKRNAGVKDSGNILPGHGGALDRFDAFLFASVVVYVYFSVVGKI